MKPDDLRNATITLKHGSGVMPALGFGTLIPDPVATRTATQAALEAGFRLLDTAERYRTEKEVGEAMQQVFGHGKIKRDDVFVITKLWNTNHRPERVKPAIEASLKRLQLDFVDLYLIHTPFAFQPGEDFDPRDSSGNVIYDRGVTLPETWGALERLVDEGKCKAIGISDVSLEQPKKSLRPRGSSRRLCMSNRIRIFRMGASQVLPGQWHRAASFRGLGHSSEPSLLKDPVITTIAQRVQQDPGAGLAGLGDPARNGSIDDLEESGPNPGKLRSFCPSRGNRARDQRRHSIAD